MMVISEKLQSELLARRDMVSIRGRYYIAVDLLIRMPDSFATRLETQDVKPTQLARGRSAEEHRVTND